jgi:hypothetical protein
VLSLFGQTREAFEVHNSFVGLEHLTEEELKDTQSSGKSSPGGESSTTSPSIERQIDSPNPMPLGLVVWQVWKARSKSSGVSPAQNLAPQ